MSHVEARGSGTAHPLNISVSLVIFSRDVTGVTFGSTSGIILEWFLFFFVTYHMIFVDGILWA